MVNYTHSKPDRCISILKVSHFGTPLTAEKTTGPKKEIKFLGIKLDSVLMQASLPLKKLTLIRETMKASLYVATMTKRELLSLLRHLNFAMRIIPQGRSFISRLLDLSKTVKKSP